MNKLKPYFAALLFLLLPLAGWAAMSLEDEIRETTDTDPRAYWHYANALYASRVGEADRATAEFQQAARYDSKSSAIHDRLALHYYVEGMDYKSVEELQKSIELAPNNVAPRMLLANLYTSQSEFGKAQREYEKILQIDPKNLEARYSLAGVLANQNRVEDAMRAYQQILIDNPKSAEVYYNMGLIYTRANQEEKAEEAFQQAIEFSANNLDVLEKAYTSLGLLYELDQQPQKAIDTYLSLVKVNSENDRAYLALGELYYNQKDDIKALAAFQNYAQLKPEDLSVYDYIGLCYFRLKDFPRAVEAFQKMLEKQPANALVRFRLAAAYEEEKDYASSEDQLQAILKNDEKSVDAWVRLALLYDKEKKGPETEKAIADGLKSNPNHPDLILMQAMVAHEKNDLKGAEESYHKVIAIELANKDKHAADFNKGSLAQAYFNLGVLMDKQNRFDEAMDQMKKVLEYQPDYADAYNYVGYSYADKGIKLDEAQKDVEAALRLDPMNSYYLDSLGWVFYKKGQYAAAQEQLAKALKNLKTSTKDDAVIYDHLAEVLTQLGQKDEAKAQWEKASQMDPENKKYLEKIQKAKSTDSL